MTFLGGGGGKSSSRVSKAEEKKKERDAQHMDGEVPERDEEGRPPRDDWKANKGRYS